MKRLLIFLLLSITSQIGIAQQKTIFGAVTSGDDGRPIRGVKVILLEVKMKRKTRELVFVESRIRTKTNEKGEYMLTISLLQENMIRFKKEDYSTIDIDVGNRTRIDLSMKLDAGRKE
jgi:hypothetical protein